jgi:hypothetical protein
MKKPSRRQNLGRRDPLKITDASAAFKRASNGIMPAADFPGTVRQTVEIRVPSA